MKTLEDSSLDLDGHDGVVSDIRDLLPLAVRAEVAQVAGTESSAGGVTDAWLVTRGLIGHGMIGDQSGPDLMTPAPGLK